MSLVERLRNLNMLATQTVNENLKIFLKRNGEFIIKELEKKAKFGRNETTVNFSYEKNQYFYHLLLDYQKSMILNEFNNILEQDEIYTGLSITSVDFQVVDYTIIIHITFKW